MLQNNGTKESSRIQKRIEAAERLADSYQACGRFETARILRIDIDAMKMDKFVAEQEE